MINNKNSKENIEKKVIELTRGLLPKRFKAKKINLDSNFKNELSLDSLKMVELYIAIEKEFEIDFFGIRFHPVTIRDLSDFIFADLEK